MKKTAAKKTKKSLFPVVGIGGSSGSIEALERLFSTIPSECGVSFIVVLHATPGPRSNLRDLLEKFTKMPMTNARNGMSIKPDRIYVCPSGKAVTVKQNILYLAAINKKNSRNDLIDGFFTSLARDRSGLAVAVVLSGTGDDGSRGIGEVKKKKGVTFAQDPLSAQYDDMPRNAIETGNVDHVGYPAEIIPMMMKILSEKSLIPESSLASNELYNKEVFDRIVRLIHDRTGRDFRLYKYNTIFRRIELRMAGRNIGSMKEYYRFLESNPDEVDLLFHDLLIKVTGFFRDGQAFRFLETKVVPDICASKKEGETIRVWSAGCGTGEEAYSCAIMFQNYLKQTGRDLNVLIFASDIDEKALAVARQGMYPKSIARDIGKDNIDVFFTAEDNAYRVRKSLRDIIVFTVHDLIQDPVFSKIDFILCRNVLIYLRRELQKKVLANLHYALGPDGYLVLGYSEGIGEFSRLFHVVNKRWKVFRKTGGSILRDFISNITPNGGAAYLPGSAADTQQMKLSDLEGHASRMILSRYAPPWVIVDGDFHILYFSNNTEQYLKHGKGKANLDIVQMASGKLKLELMTALKTVVQKNTKYVKENIPLKHKSTIKRINLVMEPMVYSKKPLLDNQYYLVIFEDAASETPLVPIPDDDHVSGEAMKDKIIFQLENELFTTRDFLQKVTNDYELSSEELKASNEEILSMNEELQSANEELQTSKEELQVLNDELTNTNLELHNKVEELTRARNDIHNLFSSTDIATIFLDSSLNLKSFTPAATEIFNFIDQDAGRPVEHFSNKINYQGMLDDAREVLLNLSKIEKEIKSPDGQHYMVRVMPYRTDLNTIDGVVLTFTNISGIKNIQTMVKHSEQRLRNIFNHTVQAFILVDDKGEVVASNTISEQMSTAIFEKPLLVGDYITQFDFTGSTRQGDLLSYYKSALNDIENELELTVLNEHDQTVYYQVRFAPVFDDERQVTGVLIRITDVSERRKYETDLIAAKERAEHSSKIKSQFLANMSHEVRTPLNGILGLARLLTESGLDDRQRDLVEKINVSGKILSSLINNILDLSRIESGRRELKAEPFDIRALMDNLVKSERLMADEKGLAMECLVEESVPETLVGDELALYQVLINLVNNAIKFTEKGTVTIAASMTGRPDGRPTVKFDVTDTGIGIAPEFLDDIFDRFTQIEDSFTKKYSGAGLGLSIVKSLISFMGGSLTVRSEVGRGSTFSVSIPLAAVEQARLPEPAARQRGKEKGDGGRYRILLVEDNAINQMFMVEMLRKRGHAVDSAFNGEEALEIISARDYDLVIMDIQMPVMDGLQCLSAIRGLEDEKKRTIPVIALTGYAMEHDRIRIMNAGFDEYAIKPVDDDLLLEKMRLMMQ